MKILIIRGKSRFFFIRSVLTIALSITSMIAFSQSMASSSKAENLLKSGDSLVEVWKLNEANKKYEKAISILENKKEWERVAYAYNKLAESHMQADEYKIANDYANKTLSILKSKFKKRSIEENNAYYIIGYYHDFVNFKFDEAFASYKKAIDVDDLPSSSTNDYLPKVYTAMGILHSKNGMYLKAIPYYEKALNMLKKTHGEESSQIADTYGNMGLNYRALGEYEKSIQYQKKALLIDIKLNGEDNPDVGILYSNMAGTYKNLLEIDKAIFYKEKALAIALPRLGEAHPFTAELYQQLAALNLEKGRPKKAKELGERALKILNSQLGKGHPETIFTLGTLGAISSYLGDTTKGLEYVEQALEITLKSRGEVHVRSGNAYSMLADIHRKNNAGKEALENDEKALKIFQQVYGTNNHPLIADIHRYIGDDLAILEKNSSAIKSYQKALMLYDNIATNNNRKKAEVLNKISTLYSEKNNFSKADTYVNKAIKTLFDEVSIDPKNQGFAQKIILLDIYKNKAKSLVKRNLIKNDSKQLSEISELYQKMDGLIDQIRDYSSQIEDKVKFTENVQRIYNGAISTYLNEELKWKENPVEKAFYYAEKGKFNLLKELTKESEAISFSGLPDKIKHTEDSLKLKRAYHISRLTNLAVNDPKNTQLKKELEDRLFDTNRKYDSLLKHIENTYPKYFSFKHDTQIIDLKTLSEKIDKNVVILEYAIVDNSTYLFVISKGNFQTLKLTTDEITSSIQDFETSILTKDVKRFKAIGLKIYNQLIDPVSDDIAGKKLIIIPDGPLWDLNFDLLITEETATNNPKKFPYLLRNNAISYANSADFQFSRKEDNQTTSNECLAFSFSNEDSPEKGNSMPLVKLRNSDDDLPGTRKEIQEISKILDGEYYYGNKAIESVFKQKAKDYGILHLALHGEVNHEDPANSRLFFTKNKDSVEDGYLYSHELFALKLPAQLAVLSACNTGSGRITSGEGVMSLGNAFQYAGTKSLVLSKWELPDESTAVLMKYFYQNLKKGMDKASSLQQAKLTYLEEVNTNKTHPFYWASFYVIGDNSAIKISNNSTWYWYLIVGIAILSILFFRKKRKSKTA